MREIDEISKGILKIRLQELDYDLQENETSLGQELDPNLPDNTKEFINAVHEIAPTVLMVLEDVTRLRKRVKKALEQLND